jgi:hypothetical protein
MLLLTKVRVAVRPLFVSSVGLLKCTGAPELISINNIVQQPAHVETWPQWNIRQHDWPTYVCGAATPPQSLLLNCVSN